MKEPDRKRRARAAVRRCRERKLAEMRDDPAHELHGTATGWTYGCRCDACRATHEAGRSRGRRRLDAESAARSSQRRERARMTMKKCRQKRLAEMREDPAHELHGTPTGWKYGCRCDACQAARRKVNAARRDAYGGTPAGGRPGAAHPWRRSRRNEE